MPEDASLDQFASPETADSEDAGDDAEDPENPEAETATESVEIEDGADSESPEVEAVEPAVSTYRWSSDGRECADCGASAERLWRGEGQKDGNLVCADCKEW